VLARAGRGEPVQFVDLATRVGRDTDFAEDGLHLSDRGNEQMAQAWFEALGPVLEASTAGHVGGAAGKR